MLYFNSKILKDLANPSAVSSGNYMSLDISPQHDVGYTTTTNSVDENRKGNEINDLKELYTDSKLYLKTLSIEKRNDPLFFCIILL